MHTAASHSRIISPIAMDPILEDNLRHLINALTTLRLEAKDGNLSGFFVLKKDEAEEKKGLSTGPKGIEAYSVQRPEQPSFLAFAIYGTLKCERIDVHDRRISNRYSSENAGTTIKNDFFILLNGLKALHISTANQHVIFISDLVAFVVNLTRILTDFTLHPYFRMPLSERRIHKEKLEIQFTAIINALKELIQHPLLSIEIANKAILIGSLNEAIKTFKEELIVKPDCSIEVKEKASKEITLPGWAEFTLFSIGIASQVGSNYFLPEYMSLIGLTELKAEKLEKAFVERRHTKKIIFILYCALSCLARGEEEDKVVSVIVSCLAEIKSRKLRFGSESYIKQILIAFIEDNCFVNPANKAAIEEKLDLPKRVKSSASTISQSLNMDLGTPSEERKTVATPVPSSNISVAQVALLTPNVPTPTAATSSASLTSLSLSSSDLPAAPGGPRLHPL